MFKLGPYFCRFAKQGRAKKKMLKKKYKRMKEKKSKVNSKTVLLARKRQKETDIYSLRYNDDNDKK